MKQTAEFVSPKHPDKICDRIADAILDACLEQDPKTRSAIEVMGGHKIITITGELTTSTYVDVSRIVKRIAGEIGVQTNIAQQSPEISQGVDKGGAGDQGIMTGYATNETKEMLPLEYVLARNLCRFIYEKYPADGKTQITIDNETKNIDCIVASFNGVKGEELKRLIRIWLGDNKSNPIILANPAGDWEVGGFDADTGVTGRKIMVDNYGPRTSVGGGAFSGKDATKVDRSGAYMARKIAVDLLKKHNAARTKVWLAYAIGIKEPVMAEAMVDGKEVDIKKDYDLSPQAIIKLLNLRKPQYEKLARWGHFGNNNLWDK